VRQAIARDVGLDDRAAFEALSNAATEDIKHIGLFREVRGRVNAALGFPLALLPEVGRVTSVVLRKHIGAVLLLTASIELLSEQHYLTCFQDDASLDPLTRHIRRPLAKPEQGEILAAVLAAKRYTLIESGLMHPSFRELFSMIPTRAQRQRVEQALGATLTTAT
jgi:hypothetical protein